MFVLITLLYRLLLKKKLVLFFSTYICFTQVTINAQNHFLNYRLQHYNTDNGLPQNSVTSIKYDKNGNMWLATQGGLVIFTGSTFIKPQQATISPRISYLIKDNSKKLFACDALSNIYSINEDAINLQQIYQKGPIFGATAFWRAYTHANDAEIKKHFHSSFHFRNIVEAVDNTQYFITDNKEFVCFDSALHFIKNVNYYAQFFTIDDKVFILFKNNSIHCYKKNRLIKANITLSVPNGVSINFLKSAFFFTSEATTYCIASNNIYKINYTENKLIFQPIIANLPNLEYIASAERNSLTGDFAIGTQTNGLYIIQTSAFSTKRNNGIPSNEFGSPIFTNSIYAHVTLSSKNILDGNGFVYSENKELGYRGFPHINTRLLSYDSFGHIWYQQLYTNKLYECDSALKVLNTYIAPSKKESLLYMSGKTKDTLYFCSINSLYRLIKNKKNPTVELLASPLVIKNLYETDVNTILILTEKGIWVYNKNTSAISFLKESENKYFRSIGLLKSGAYLLGTYGQGVYVYKNNSLISLPLDKNQNLKTAHCFLKDNKGFIWISTNNGLFQASEQDIENYVSGSVSEIYYHFYDKTHGFLSNEFNGGFQNVANLSKDESLMSFSSINGIVFVNNKKNMPILPNNSLHFYNIHTDDSTFNNLSSHITLPPSIKNLSIEVITSFFGNIENLNIKYRLLNYDSAWKDINDDNIIKFNQLNPGEYVLEVKKINGFEKNNYTIKKIEINVEERWYQKWWFILSCFLMLLVLIYFIIHLRTNRLSKQKLKLEALVKQRNEELLKKNEKLQAANRQNEIIHSILIHDIKGPLKFLVEISEGLNLNWIKFNEESKKRYIQDINFTSNEIYNFVFNFLGWVKVKKNDGLHFEEVNLHNLVENLTLVKIKEKFIRKNIILLNKVNEELTLITHPQILIIILNNLIDNACKYTTEGFITIDAKKINNKTIISIIDTGVGISSEKINYILSEKNNGEDYLHSDSFKLGYVFINQLLPLINCNISIQSILGEGTTINLTF